MSTSTNNRAGYDRPISAVTTYEAQPTSCHCGGRLAWVEINRSQHAESQMMRGCVCHQHPRNLDLEEGTLLPRQAWVIIGQRGLQMTFGADEEATARHELADLDDKYRPAYLGRATISAITIVAVNEFCSSANVGGVTEF